MTVLSFPQLTARGIDLDLGSDSIGLLRSSIDVIDEPAVLRQRIAKDGYLFLPGYLNKDEVLVARAELISRLDAEDFLDPNYPPMDGIVRPMVEKGFMPELALNNKALDKLLYAGPMMEFYERFFGEEVRHYDFTWLRAATYGQNASPHCDIVYMGRGTFDVLTAWTPLADIPLDHGVLMVLEGSHLKREQLKEYLSRDVDTYCTNGPNAKKIEDGEMSWEFDGVLNPDARELRRSLGGRWLTEHFRPGDLLTFGMGTVHCSADNLTNKIRLSTDTRYQRASEPADERWIGPTPIGHSAAGKRGRIC